MNKHSPCVFKYFTAPKHGKYSFEYKRRSLWNKWFIYNAYPFYGRYWFYYEIIDEIHIENNEVLLCSNQRNVGHSNTSTLYRLNPTRHIEMSIIDDIYTIVTSPQQLKSALSDYLLWNTRRGGMDIAIDGTHNLHRDREHTLSLGEFIVMKRINTHQAQIQQQIYNVINDSRYNVDNKLHIHELQEQLSKVTKLTDIINNQFYMTKLEDDIFQTLENHFTIKDGHAIHVSNNVVNTNKKSKDIIYNYHIETYLSKLPKCISHTSNENSNMVKIPHDIHINTPTSNTNMKKVSHNTQITDTTVSNIVKIPHNTLTTHNETHFNNKINKPIIDMFGYVVQSTRTTTAEVNIVPTVDLTADGTASEFKHELYNQKSEIHDLIRQTDNKINIDMTVSLDRTAKESDSNIINEKPIITKRTANEDYMLSMSFTRNIIPIERQEYNTRIEKPKDSQLDLYKRLWFIKQYDTVDYKILPQNDYEYPPDIGIMVHKPNGIYGYQYQTLYQDVHSIYDNMRPYVIEIYDNQYNQLDYFVLPELKTGTYKQGNFEVELTISDKPNDLGYYSANNNITIHNLENVAYIIIREPLNEYDNHVIYSTTEKFIEDKHPIPIGVEMGIKEIPIHIPIMIEFVNVLLLFWSKYYLAFTGYTGTMAIYGMINMVYDWLTLASSIEHAGDAMEDYQRCYRWFRWEAEKVYNKAKHDPDLNGNLWVEEILFEMIDYIEMHHVDVIPLFKTTELMDEFRDVFQDPSFDIEFILNKAKGVRKRVIDKHKRLND